MYKLTSKLSNKTYNTEIYCHVLCSTCQLGVLPDLFRLMPLDINTVYLYLIVR